MRILVGYQEGMMLEAQKKSKQYKITIKNASIASGLSSFINEDKIDFSSIIERYLECILFNKTSADYSWLQDKLRERFNYSLKTPSFFVTAPFKKTYLIRIKPDLYSALNTYLALNKTTLSELINNFFDHLLSSEMVTNTLNTLFWGSWFKTNVDFLDKKDKKEDDTNTETTCQKLLEQNIESLLSDQIEENNKHQKNTDKTAINHEQQILIAQHQNFLKRSFEKQTRTQFVSIHFNFSTHYKKNFKAVFYEKMKKELLEYIELLYLPNSKDAHFLICFGVHANIKRHKKKVELKKLPPETDENDALESNDTNESNDECNQKAIITKTSNDTNESNDTKPPKSEWIDNYNVSMRFLIVYIGTIRYTLGENGKNTANIVSLFDDFDGLYPNEYPHIVLHQPWFSKKVFDRLDFSSIQTVKRNAVLPLSATKQYKVPDSPLFPGDIYISIKSKPKSPFSYNKKKNFFSIGNKGNDKDKNATHCGFIFSLVDIEEKLKRCK